MISAKDFFFFYYCRYRGCLDFQLPMESVLITTNVVSLNPTEAGCTRYNNV